MTGHPAHVTLPFHPEIAWADIERAIRLGNVSRQEEATQLPDHTDDDGQVDWPGVHRALGLPKPVTFWNKFGG